MTDRAYYHNDNLEMTSEVISCDPDDNGQYRVILSSTLFHPQGGGQPSDQGTLGGVEVVKVSQEEGQLIHLLAASVPPGPVTIKVDGQVRAHHTRMHSAGHLIGVVGEQFGWYATKGDHRPGAGRIVFVPGEQSTKAVDVAELERLTQALVAADLPRVLSEQEGMRKVTWGTLPAYACGGTHVLSTAQVGLVRITSAKEKKGQISVQYQLD